MLAESMRIIPHRDVTEHTLTRQACLASPQSVMYTVLILSVPML
jgi:hypothetical protein